MYEYLTNDFGTPIYINEIHLNGITIQWEQSLSKHIMTPNKSGGLFLVVSMANGVPYPPPNITGYCQEYQLLSIT